MIAHCFHLFLCLLNFHILITSIPLHIFACIFIYFINFFYIITFCYRYYKYIFLSLLLDTKCVILHKMFILPVSQFL